VKLRLPALVLAATVAAFVVSLLGPQGESGKQNTGLVARFLAPNLGPESAYARRIISPEFASPLELAANSRQIFATGPLGCDPGEKWRVDVVITQGDATAAGHTQGHCSGRIGAWQVRAVARGPASFQAGRATGCATFLTRKGGNVTDTFHWCQDLLLQPAG
jgi:hypothetical protein